MISRKLLLKCAFDHGFHDACVISSKRIQRIFNHFKGDYEPALSIIEEQWINFFHFHPFSCDFTILLCGLSCYRNEQDQPRDGVQAWGTFAPFARRNYYKEAVQRLKILFKEIREQTGILKKQGRVFCNSRAPEKFLAWAGGLGSYGKNSLIIHKTLGSLFIIAGLFLLIPIKEFQEPDMPEAPGTLCGSCHACLDACPTNALTTPGFVDQSVCIQALSTRLIILPEYIKEAFGNRIYGCQVCQNICPFNRNLYLETHTFRGEVGPWIPLEKLLSMPPPKLREYLKKTVPGSSWIDTRALQRNALLAAGNLKCGSLLPIITGYIHHPHPALSDAAIWAVEKLEGS